VGDDSYVTPAALAAVVSGYDGLTDRVVLGRRKAAVDGFTVLDSQAGLVMSAAALQVHTGRA
jgi:hypothetical protein